MFDIPDDHHLNWPQTLGTCGDQTPALIWQALGDPVMGGRSSGTLDSGKDGHGHFHGTVRLDNGGGP